MTRRERRIVMALADGLVDPRPPLPPVEATDLLQAYEAALAPGPALNRHALRAAVHLVDRAAPRLVGERGPLHLLDRDRRVAALEAAAHHKVLAPVLEALRGVVHLAYYGDLGVLHALGYDPEAVRARARGEEVPA